MKKLFTFLFTGVFLSLLTVFPTQISAQNTKAWSIGTCVSNESVGGGNTVQVATLQGVECVVTNILTIAITAVGIAAGGMLVVGAFLYLTSGGNPKSTDAGQKAITFAIAGIVVALSAWVILNFIGIFTGTSSSIGTFRINWGDELRR